MQPADGSRFYRGSDRVLGGGCSGIAAALKIDPPWVRLAFGVLALVQGIRILLYVVLWILMPERADTAGARRQSGDELLGGMWRVWSGNQTGLWVGVVLIGGGLVLLAGNLGLLRWDVLWPVIVIAI